VTLKRLLIYLSSPTAEAASWVVLDETGTVQQNILLGKITDLNVFAHGFDITVIIPGQEVLLVKATLPKLNRSRLLQALPYALEEHVVEDVQNLHFAIGDYQADGTLPVAIISRQKIAAYTAILKQIGIPAKRIIPATLALPFTPHQWQLALFGEICLVRMDLHHGFACDSANIQTLLDLQLTAAPQKPECLQIHHFCDQALTVHTQDITFNDIRHTNKSFLEVIATWFNPNTAINLLQGDYTYTDPSSFAKKIWVFSGALTAAWICLLFLSKAISYTILQSSLHHSELAINAIYKTHFPAATNIVAPRERMQEKLKKQSSHGGNNYVLGLLGIVGKSLHQAPQIQIKHLDFRENSLTLALTASSFEALDAFSQTLKQQGLIVKQQSAGMTDSGAKANLIIRTGAT
jgi:general secretion pathway protein L